MQCSRALAKTLTGTATEVSYPAMPVAIKTPSCPTVVSPSSESQAEWQITETADGVKALQYINGQLVGFALAGDSVVEKQVLTRSLPAIF